MLLFWSSLGSLHAPHQTFHSKCSQYLHYETHLISFADPNRILSLVENRHRFLFIPKIEIAIGSINPNGKGRTSLATIFTSQKMYFAIDIYTKISMWVFYVWFLFKKRNTSFTVIFSTVFFRLVFVAVSFTCLLMMHTR